MLVFMEDGRTLPITNMFDVDGDETDDPAMAVSVVAALPDGKWLAAQCYEGEIKQVQM